MLFEFLCWFFKAEFASSWNVILNFRLALQREAEERRKAEEMNKKLEEKARSLEMTAREAAEGNFKNAQVSKRSGLKSYSLLFSQLWSVRS
jgi:hypothetical protein